MSYPPPNIPLASASASAVEFSTAQTPTTPERRAAKDKSVRDLSWGSEHIEEYEMVQSYSATGDVREVERVEGTGESEGSALLGGTVSQGVSERPVEKRQGHATLMSSASNLANTIIGSGESWSPSTHRSAILLTDDMVLTRFNAAFQECSHSPLLVSRLCPYHADLPTDSYPQNRPWLQLESSPA